MPGRPDFTGGEREKGFPSSQCNSGCNRGATESSALAAHEVGHTLESQRERGATASRVPRPSAGHCARTAQAL